MVPDLSQGLSDSRDVEEVDFKDATHSGRIGGAAGGVTLVGDPGVVYKNVEPSVPALDRPGGLGYCLGLCDVKLDELRIRPFRLERWLPRPLPIPSCAPLRAR